MNVGCAAWVGYWADGSKAVTALTVGEPMTMALKIGILGAITGILHRIAKSQYALLIAVCR